MNIQGSFISLQVKVPQLPRILSNEDTAQILLQNIANILDTWSGSTVLKFIMSSTDDDSLECVGELEKIINKAAPPVRTFVVDTCECQLRIVSSRWKKLKDPFLRFKLAFEEDSMFYVHYDTEMRVWKKEVVTLTPEELLLKEKDCENRRSIILGSYDAKTILKYLSPFL
jgi:hypothetical protein